MNYLEEVVNELGRSVQLWLAAHRAAGREDPVALVLADWAVLDGGEGYSLFAVYTRAELAAAGGRLAMAVADPRANAILAVVPRDALGVMARINRDGPAALPAETELASLRVDTGPADRIMASALAKSAAAATN